MIPTARNIPPTQPSARQNALYPERGPSNCSLALVRGVAEADLYCACSFNSPFICSRVAWSILDCARRTSTFLSCAFREQEDGQATLPILLRPRVARARGSSQLPHLLFQHPVSGLRCPGPQRPWSISRQRKDRLGESPEQRTGVAPGSCGSWRPSALSG